MTAAMQSAGQAGGFKRWVLAGAKIAISGLLIYWLSQKFDYRDAFVRIGSVGHGSLPLIAALSIVQIGLLGVRWHIVAKWWKSGLARRDAFSTLFAGLFFGQAMPSSLGGDAVRILLLNRRHSFRLTAAILATMTDRAIGMISLLLLFLVALPVLASTREGTSLVASVERWQGPLSIAVAVVIALAVAFSAAPATRRWIAPKVRSFLERTLLIASLSRSSLLAVLALGLSAHAALLIGAFVWFSGFHAVAISTFVAITSIALFVAALPISIGGWGVREASFVGLFALVNVPPDDALLLGLGFGVLSLLQGLICGLIWAGNEVVWRRKVDLPRP